MNSDFWQAFDLRTPLTLAGLQCPARSDVTPRLALHGWLDNADSMAPLMRALHQQDGAASLCLDLPGHGLSGHPEAHVHAAFVDYIDHLWRAVNAWRAHPDPIDLIGHSMGGGIATLFAAAFPERVRRLILIDSIGPIAGTPESFASDLRKGLLARHRPSSKKPSYASIEEATQARLGQFGIESEQIRQFIERCLQVEGDGWTWRSDSRLMKPTPIRMTEPQVLSAINAIQAPTLLILATPRTVFLDSPPINARLEHWRKKAQLIEILGNHHLHLGERMSEVQSAIETFLHSSTNRS